MTAKATRTLALVMSVLLMASIAIPGAVAGAEASDGDLTLEVVQDDDSGEVTVTVSHNNSTVENATVNVSTVDENKSYAGNGSYTTDENGTVGLPAPDLSVNISVEASYDNHTVATTKELEGAGLAVDVTQSDDGTVLIEVDFDNQAASGANVTVEGDYEYNGTKTTDQNGTVEFPPPTNDTKVNITAEYDGHSAFTQASLEARNDSNPNNDFAQALVAFIHSLDIDGMEGPPGQKISDFVHEHNPSNADDNAGPPEHAGPPDHAGPKNETLNGTVENETDGQGPPEWAGPPGNETDDSDSDKRGPPGDKGKNEDGNQD